MELEQGRGLPRRLSGKESRDEDSIPGSGRSPGERNGNPLQYSCLRNPMNRGASWRYSPWGHKESDTTEGLKNKSRVQSRREIINSFQPIFSKMEKINKARTKSGRKEGKKICLSHNKSLKLRSISEKCFKYCK